MKFRTWLKTRDESNDAVGDLVADYNLALKMEHRTPFSVHLNDENPLDSWDVERLMEKYNAHTTAWDALKDAYDEYNAERPGTPYPMSREDNKGEK